jgi:hypothetical protein
VFLFGPEGECELCSGAERCRARERAVRIPCDMLLLPYLRFPHLGCLCIPIVGNVHLVDPCSFEQVTPNLPLSLRHDIGLICCHRNLWLQASRRA